MLRSKSHSTCTVAQTFIATLALSIKDFPSAITKCATFCAAGPSVPDQEIQEAADSQTSLNEAKKAEKRKAKKARQRAARAQAAAQMAEVRR